MYTTILLALPPRFSDFPLALSYSTIALVHGLRTPREEIAFTARPKIHSHSQIFRYGRSGYILAAKSAQIFRFL